MWVRIAIALAAISGVGAIVVTDAVDDTIRNRSTSPPAKNTERPAAPPSPQGIPGRVDTPTPLAEGGSKQARPEARPEMRPEVRPEIKPEVRPEVRPSPGPALSPAAQGGQPEPRPSVAAPPAGAVLTRLPAALPAETPRVDLNTGSLEQLDTLPGAGRIGRAIIRGRPYGSLEALVEKRVVSRATFDRIKNSIEVR